ncbi:hypothetical protein HZA96_01215 [Candidatus Woesearchaeota archaeon]|nr:hypothetical protein [Candidatus Woesearchaeota archaeon]
MVRFQVKDIRNTKAFPQLDYRFSTLEITPKAAVLERDYLGENPLHYFIDTAKSELTVGNNIADIKKYLENNQREFNWERVRAVSNNSRVTIDDVAFQIANPQEEERDCILQDYILQQTIDFADLAKVGAVTRKLLEDSVQQRIAAITETQLGILLSGGLDSMSVAYLLAKVAQKSKSDQTADVKKITAFTLKVNEDDHDIIKSREIAKQLSIDLAEVKLIADPQGITIALEKYNPQRELLYIRKVAEARELESVITESLRISGNPKKDNLFCAAAMYLIAQAVRTEGISAVFCGEGPNEMINDYGYIPKELGYATEDKGDVVFREVLTFGLKKNDRQLGRGGLAKHAICRMGKIFAEYGIRLEAPYFNRDIAKVLTNVPHLASYDTIKQQIVAAMFQGEGLDVFIEGTAKEKFQDGSGVSGLLKEYSQQRLIERFEQIYGVRKNGYLM